MPARVPEFVSRAEDMYMVSRRSKVQRRVKPDYDLDSIIDRTCEYLSDIHARWNHPDEPLALALWVLQTWLVRRREYQHDYTTYLYVISHGENSGKTELAKSLIRICDGAEGILPTVAQMKRFLSSGDKRVMMIDQFHNLGHAKSVDRETLEAILCQGFGRGFPLKETAPDGTPVYHETFYPKALFGISSFLPSAEVLSRCMRITVYPATLDDARELSARQDERSPVDNGNAIHDLIAAWMTDARPGEIDARMSAMGKVIPLNDGLSLHNRDADNWRMMFVLADMAGPDYGKRIREFARTMTTSHLEISEADVTECARIDGLIIRLARTGRLPVDNWHNQGKSPVTDNPDVTVTASDLGWPRDKRYGKNNRLPAVSLLASDGKREAELRIKATELDQVAGALGYTRGDFIRAYRNAGRLHAQKGRTDHTLQFYSGHKPSKVYAIDFTPVIYGDSSDMWSD